MLGISYFILLSIVHLVLPNKAKARTLSCFLIMMHIHVLYIRMFFPIVTRLLFIVTSIDHLHSTSKRS